MNWQEFYDTIQEAYHIEDEKTVIKIPFENITEVTREYLIYKNQSGTTEKIDLADCVKNFNFTLGKELKNRLGETIRAVGGRCFLSARAEAFYELFTAEHHTRFYIPLKQTPFKKFLRKIGWNPDSKAYSKFYSLQKKLVSFGYSAIDLT